MKSGWKTEALGSLCDILDSQRKPITKRDRTPGEYPYYGATGILDFVEGYLFDEPLVLVGEDGAKWGSGENTAFAVQGKCWVNNHAHVLRPHRSVLTDNWLIYFLVHSDLSEFVSGLTVPKLNQGSLREIPIPVPPLLEQQRIVGILDEAFENISTAKANAEKNLQNARALFESHLQSVFTQRGPGWEIKTLGDLFEITSSKRVFESEWERSGVPFYRAREIVKLAHQGFVDNELFISEEMFNQYSTKYGIPKEGDIMVTGVGTLGICYVVKKHDRFYFKDGNIIWLKKKTEANSRFVEHAFRSDFLRKQIDDSVGATVGTFTIIKAKNTLIPLPPTSEQPRIVEQLDLLRGKTQRLGGLYEHKLAALEALKKSLLHQAFAGEL